MINIFEQETRAIIKFDFNQIVLEKVRGIEGRWYHEEFKHWSIPLDQVEEFCASCDQDSLPYEINPEIVETLKPSFATPKQNKPPADSKPPCVKKLPFSDQTNKQQSIVHLHIQDASDFSIRLKQGFAHRDRLTPFATSNKGDKFIFDCENLWEVLQECKKQRIQVIM